MPRHARTHTHKHAHAHARLLARSHTHVHARMHICTPACAQARRSSEPKTGEDLIIALLDKSFLKTFKARMRTSNQRGMHADLRARRHRGVGGLSCVWGLVALGARGVAHSTQCKCFQRTIRGWMTECTLRKLGIDRSRSPRPRAIGRTVAHARGNGRAITDMP